MRLTHVGYALQNKDGDLYCIAAIHLPDNGKEFVNELKPKMDKKFPILAPFKVVQVFVNDGVEG